MATKSALAPRSSEDRMEELLALHDQLNSATKGSIGRGAKWTSLHRRFLQLPLPLEAALVTVNLLGYLEQDGGRSQVEDLIAHGEESETYGRIFSLWESLGNDKNRPVEWWSSKGPEQFGTLASYPGNAVGALSNPSSPEQVMEHFVALREEVGLGYLFSEIAFVLRSLEATTPQSNSEIIAELLKLTQLDSRNFYSIPGYGVSDSLFYPAFSAMGTVTEEKVLRLIDLAQEYNLEWALAAFEWSEEGRSNTPLGRLQTIVDEAPWSEVPWSD